MALRAVQNIAPCRTAGGAVVRRAETRISRRSVRSSARPFSENEPKERLLPDPPGQSPVRTNLLRSQRPGLAADRHSAKSGLPEQRHRQRADTLVAAVRHGRRRRVAEVAGGAQ